MSSFHSPHIVCLNYTRVRKSELRVKIYKDSESKLHLPIQACISWVILLSSLRFSLLSSFVILILNLCKYQLISQSFVNIFWCFGICWIVLWNLRYLLIYEEFDHFLAYFGYWIKNWKVKYDITTLWFDLIWLCEILRKSHQLRNHWIDNYMLNVPNESRTLEKLWLVKFRYFISPWKRVVILRLLVLK